MKEIRRADFRHFVPLTVRWGDLDALGHVNNTVFFRYSEEGRIRYFMETGVATGPSTQGSGLILADMRCSFVTQLHYPGEIEIASRTQALGNSSMHMQQALFHKGQDEIAAIFKAVVVWFDYAAQRPARVPDSIREAIASYEIVPISSSTKP